MNDPIIVREYRGEVVENIHPGVICVVDQNKDVIFQKGNIEQPIYYRSAMKPLQAIPFYSEELPEKYQLTNDEAALSTASQRGEIYHQKSLESMMKKLDFLEEDLICPKSYPLNGQPKDDYIRDRKEPRKLFHNCAGKHLGILAYAREKGYPIDDYESPDHPVQKEILSIISELTETPIQQIFKSTDGCGLPIYAVPLKNMAISFLKFVDQSSVKNQQLAKTLDKIGHSMNKSPKIVASHDFTCTVLLEDENIVAKGGAQGVYCLALREEKISIALKVYSGSEAVWPILIARILEKLNYKNHETIDRLLKLRPEHIKNDSGLIVGRTEVDLS